MNEYSIAKHKQDREVAEKVEQAMTALIDATNVMGAEEAVIKGMWDALRKNHPTLQQNFVRSLVGLGKTVEEKGYKGDARNSAALEILKDIGNTEKALPFI